MILLIYHSHIEIIRCPIWVTDKPAHTSPAPSKYKAGKPNQSQIAYANHSMVVFASYATN